LQIGAGYDSLKLGFDGQVGPKYARENHRSGTAHPGDRQQEAWQIMSETTDMEEIRALEQRITTALDRIGQGLAARPATATGLASQNDQEGRIAALEAALAETQAALASEQSANSDLSEKLKAIEAARQADTDAASRERAALGEELDAARAAVAAAEAQAETAAATARDAALAEVQDAGPPEPDPRLAELEAEVERQRDLETTLRRRISRLRDERKTARANQNEAVEQLEEVQGKLDQLQALVDSSAPEATGELARLRESNRVLRDTVDELKEAITSDGDADSDLFASVLSAELESLKADSAAEAAEARAILAEMRPILEGGQANA